MRMFVLTVLLALYSSIAIQSVSFDIVVAQDGTGNFTKITDAILYAPSHSSKRFNIRIKEGFYSENINIEMEKTNLVFIGDGMGKTIISGNRSVSSGFKTYYTATAVISGSGFIARDICFQNAAGPKGNQAVALMSTADYSSFYRCRFEGYQDTLCVHRGFQFYRECEVYGTVDFIFGKASVVLQNCILYARRPLPWQSNAIAAQGRESDSQEGGIIIQNCTITAAEDLRPYRSTYNTYLGRPWKLFARTVIMQSFIDDLINPRGWLEWKDQGVNNVYYAEYGNRGPGANTVARVPWAKVINKSTEAANFTVRNFIQGDSWIPATGIPYYLDLL